MAEHLLATDKAAALRFAAEAAVKTAVLAGMVVLIHLGWLLAGAALARALRDPRASRAVNLALAGILLVASAIAILA